MSVALYDTFQHIVNQIEKFIHYISSLYFFLYSLSQKFHNVFVWNFPIFQVLTRVANWPYRRPNNSNLAFLKTVWPGKIWFGHKDSFGQILAEFKNLAKFEEFGQSLAKFEGFFCYFEEIYWKSKCKLIKKQLSTKYKNHFLILMHDLHRVDLF